MLNVLYLTIYSNFFLVKKYTHLALPSTEDTDYNEIRKSFLSNEWKVIFFKPTKTFNNMIGIKGLLQVYVIYTQVSQTL